MTAPTTLYRFYDNADRLLYVGIAGNPGRRFSEHNKDKRWWDQVARSTMEHFTTREAAAAAEVAAIVTEQPLHNVAHAQRSHIPAVNSGTTYLCNGDCWGTGRYRYRTRWGQCRHTEAITLKPELHLSPCIDEVYGEWEEYCPRSYRIGGRGQVEVWYWMRRVIANHGGAPPYYVPIYWGVETDHTFETAPFGHMWGNEHCDLGDFLSYFSQPFDVEAAEYVNWHRLPIGHRFPEFAAALGWQPSPLEASCPFYALYDHTMAAHKSYMRTDA